MIKKKIDKTCLGGGVRHFEIGQSKRFWLTLILSFICAALLCCAFVLPFSGKNNTKTASANAVDISTITPTVNFGSAKYYKNNSLPESVSITNDFTSTAFDSVKVTRGTNKVTVSMTQSASRALSIVAIPVTISVSMPAYTVYTLDMTYGFKCDGSLGRSNGLFDDWSDNQNSSFTYNPDTSGSGKISGLRIDDSRPLNYTNSISYGDYPANNGVSLYNNTGSTKIVSTYNYYFSTVHDDTETGTNSYSFSLTFNSIKVVSVETIGNDPEAVGDTTKPYNGGKDVTFDFKYDLPTVSKHNTINYDTAYKNIKASVQSAEYFSNSPIASSTYSLGNHENGTPTSSNGTFKATEAGTYILRFDLTEEAKDNGITWTGGDEFKLLTFTIEKTRISLPQLIGASSKEYNYGDAVEFNFSGATYVNITSDGMDPEESGDYCTLSAADVGNYQVVFKLKDATNYEWDSAVGGGTDDKIFSDGLEITPKTATFSASIDGGEWSWARKTTKEVVITVSDVAAGDLPNLTINATYSKDGVPKNIGAATYDVSSKKYKLTIPSISQIATYTLTLTLADGGNYTLETPYTQPFKITGTKAPFNEQYIVWQYTVDGETVQINDFVYDGDVVLLEYVGSEYTFSVDEFALLNIETDSGDTISVKVSSKGYGREQSAKNVKTDNGGIYTVSVWIEAYDAYTDFNETEFTLTYKIVPKVLDFTDAEWEWQYNDDGDSWNAYSASNKPSVNDGKAVSVRISPTYLAGLGLNAGDYTDNYINNNTMTDQGAKSTTATLTITNGNYTTADGMGVESITFNWEITAQALEYSWTGSQNVTANTATGEKAFEFPAVEFADGQAHSEYFVYVFTVDGTDYTKEALEQYIGENWDETKPAITGSVKVVLKDGVTEVTLKPASGNAPTAMFTTGTPKSAITVTITGNGSEYGKVGFTISVTRNTANESQRTKVTVSGGTIESRIFEASDSALVVFVNGLRAGSYKITVSLNPGEESSYTLVGDYDIEFEILKQKVELPTLKEVVFSGSTIYFKDCIDGFDANLMKIIGIDDGGIDFGREWRENGYYTTIVLLDGDNYEFVKTTVIDDGETPVRLALTAETEKVETLGSEYEYNWMINKFRITDKMWDKSGKNGATIKLPSQFKALVADPEVLKIDYQYFNDQHGEALEKYSFKNGNSFYVSATLSGSDADNFEFENQSLTSDKTVYTVPQSKAEKLLNNTLTVVKNNKWLFIGIGIGLLLLILLIIIIAVAVKRKKKREAELKEEKRLEREERMMRMQMGGGAAAQMPITAAGMIAAQQQTMPAAMPVQPQPVQQPMQQPVQQAMPTQMPAQMSQSQPVMQQSAPAQTSGGSSVTEMMAMMFAQVAAMKADNADKEIAALKSEKEITALKTELEIMKLKMEQLKDDKKVLTSENKREFTPEFLGALIASAMRENITSQSATVTELPATAESDTAVHAVYPPDAVVTTTTTVDTTQKPMRRERDGGRSESGLADIDGFYDSID